MIRTYEIDLDEGLVESAAETFESLGTDIDSAINIFLRQTVLQRALPFEVIAQENKNEEPSEIASDNLHGGITEEEEFLVATNSDSFVSSVSPEITARVAANEALVAEMRNEIGEKNVTPEFEENEDDGTHGNYEQQEVESEVAFEESETVTENDSAEDADSEDEDETTPDNLFDAWGDDEEIGCR